MWYLYGLTLIAGIANAVQAGTNGTLAKGVAQPVTAGLIVALVMGTALLAIGLVSGRLSLPSQSEAGAMPAWAWCGGLLGSLVVMAQLTAAQKIGAAPFLAILVTAGVVTSIALDHFGWIGFVQHPASLSRILGGMLMIGGVALVALG